MLRQQASAPSATAGLARFQASSALKVHGPGSCLYEQGDAFNGLYRLESGLVGLRKVDEDGSTMLVGLLRPGDFIGYAPLLAGGAHLTSAEVLKTSRISFVEPSRARHLLHQAPVLLEALLRQATRDLSALQDRHFQMVTRKADERLAALLVALGCGAEVGPAHVPCSMTLPLLNRDIADLIGIRPETLSRAIARLRERGIATWDGRNVFVSDVAHLMAAAGCAANGAAMAAA